MYRLDASNDPIETILWATENPYEQKIVQGKITYFTSYKYNNLFDVVVAVNQLGKEFLEDSWAQLPDGRKIALLKFLRIVQSKNKDSWFSSIRLFGDFWNAAKKSASSWVTTRLIIDARQLSKNAASSSSKPPQIIHLGHYSFFIHLEFDNKKVWNAVVNPHEKNTIEFEKKKYMRLSPPVFFKHELPAIDAVIVTREREDCLDEESAHYFRIFNPTFFLPSANLLLPGNYQVITTHRTCSFLMLERNSNSRLPFHYFHPHCKKNSYNHSGSWLFSFPTAPATHVLFLGTNDCCSGKDIDLHLQAITKCCDLVDVLYLPSNPKVLKIKDRITEILHAKSVQFMQGNWELDREMSKVNS